MKARTNDLLQLFVIFEVLHYANEANPPMRKCYRLVGVRLTVWLGIPILAVPIRYTNLVILLPEHHYEDRITAGYQEIV